jgi:serine/threonine protein kinase
MIGRFAAGKPGPCTSSPDVAKDGPSLNMTAHSNWNAFADSPFPWERDALDFVSARLPTHEPYRAWSLFEFIALDGTVNEVDLLVFAPYGFFLVEIKSRPGRLTGDAGTWTWESDGRRTSTDNPLKLANLKAKKLRDLLNHQAAARRGNKVPFIEPLVFLSAPDLQCDLTGTGNLGVCLRDRDEGRAADGRVIAARPGIMAAIRQRNCPGMQSTTGRAPLDRPTAKIVARAIEEAGIRQSNRQRRVSDYVLEHQIDEGPNFQDWQASHATVPDTKRRIRVYPLRGSATQEDRQIHQRAAVREFQLLENLRHDRILQAMQFTEHDLGPAIIFEHDPTAIRLDHFLSTRDRDLTISTRLDLIRQLAEVMQFAHKKRVVHRALSPRSVLVLDADSEKPRVKVFNWQVGYRASADQPGATQGITATSHVGQLVDDPTTAYMAPDVLVTPNESLGEHLDVFSLGAVAYHILSGQPPAADGAELATVIRKTRGLQLAAVLDGAGGPLCDLIRYATHPEVSKRFDTVTDFIEHLDLAEDDLTDPAGDEVDNPAEAQVGDVLPGGLRVERRIGQGSCSIALLVTRGTGDNAEELILKAASAPEHSDRVRAEAAVLKRLSEDRDNRVVAFVESADIGETAGFLMRPVFADLLTKRIETLGSRLRKEGRLHIDLLQRFGEDLIGVVAHLDRRGITHRDIKPDNIAVGLSSHEHVLQIVLFDFSLVSVPPENIRAGTPGYLDPLLPVRTPSPRFDNYAERYAVAATLHEMATGTLPRWGDGRSDPSQIEDEITIDADLFDAGLRERLAVFFRRAFRRDLSLRFDNAEQMLSEWRACFEGLAVGPIKEDHDDEADLHRQLATATLDTAVAALGLGTRATNALDRANVLTVQELLAFNRTKFDRMPGVGAKTRREIVTAVRILRERLQPNALPVEAKKPAAITEVPVDTVIEAVPENPAKLTLDELAARLLAAQNSRSKAATGGQVVEHLLGRVPNSPLTDPWPTQSAIAGVMQVTRARIGQIVGRLFSKASKDVAVSVLRDEIVAMVDAQGGVATAEELADQLLAARTSELAPEAAERLSHGLVRIAVEVEGLVPEPRLVARREGAAMIVARSDELADYGVRLGRSADRAIETPPDEPLPSPARVIERLRGVAAPPGTTITDGRLVRLAATASHRAAVSSRMELYPRDMEPLRALKLSLGAVSGVRELSEHDLRERVTSRYPDAAPLPARPALDELLREVGLQLTYAPDAAGGKGGYRAPDFERRSVTTGSTLMSRYATYMPTGSATEITPEIADARSLEARLHRALRDGSFLQMVVSTKAYDRAAEELVRRFGVELVDVEAIVLDALRQAAAAAPVEWHKVEAADASRGGPDWDRLQRLASRCRPTIASRLFTPGKTPLLVYADILVRYDFLNLLAELQGKIGTADGPHGVWLLISGGNVPLLDGQPTGVPGQKAIVPESWVRNAHRSELATSGT